MDIDLSQTTETASPILNATPSSAAEQPTEENAPGSEADASTPKDKYAGFFRYYPHPDDNDPDYHFTAAGIEAILNELADA